jgi:hypothetical protein
MGPIRRWRRNDARPTDRGGRVEVVRVPLQIAAALLEHYAETVLGEETVGLVASVLMSTRGRQTRGWDWVAAGRPVNACLILRDRHRAARGRARYAGCLVGIRNDCYYRRNQSFSHNHRSAPRSSRREQVGLAGATR